MASNTRDSLQAHSSSLEWRDDIFRPDDFEDIDVYRSPGPDLQRESISAWRDAWLRLKSNRMAMFWLTILLIIVIMSIVGPLLTPYDYYTNDLMNTNKPPSAEHWFGTDDLGRDMFERVWMGATISLRVGLFAALIDLFIGVIYGGIMGYFGGRVDEIMNRAAEILYSIPHILIIILLVVIMTPSLFTIVLALGLTGWVNMAWIVRGQIMQLKNMDYVMASRSLGASSARIIFRHLIPNTLGPILVTLMLTVPSAIFAEAFLSFLGLGVQSPAASWGTMISDARSAMTVFPWRLFFPAAFISLTMLAFNLFGDGLRDAFDPKMRK
ncbi:ABC transporter permease [Cohnella pontilimi]|uniref:ABC transporter permease n=1 Tax=Cohnella pontilimi TaxID=2564100 RepID=A0A4U0FHI5_9BACL|nr:ABC transporter permease [Cohnella pontilimi]TJY42892.1 ABC transporter permease [Cohnella pontilimi]